MGAPTSRRAQHAANALFWPAFQVYPGALADGLLSKVLKGSKFTAEKATGTFPGVPTAGMCTVFILEGHKTLLQCSREMARLFRALVNVYAQKYLIDGLAHSMLA